jgi:hypothetical protein
MASDEVQKDKPKKESEQIVVWELFSFFENNPYRKIKLNIESSILYCYRPFIDLIGQFSRSSRINIVFKENFINLCLKEIWNNSTTVYATFALRQKHFDWKRRL